MSKKNILLELIPESISGDENVHACGEALNPSLAEVAEKVDLPNFLATLDFADGTTLDHLAFGWDAATWRDSWPIELKRSVIRNVVVEKRKRGTLRAVKDALASIGSAYSITEWWQEVPKGKPHTFTVTATLSKIEGVLDKERQEDLIRAIDDAKPVRSHFKLVLIQGMSGTLGFSGHLRSLAFARVADLDGVVNMESGIGFVGAFRFATYSRSIHL